MYRQNLILVIVLCFLSNCKSTNNFATISDIQGSHVNVSQGGTESSVLVSEFQKNYTSEQIALIVNNSKKVTKTIEREIGDLEKRIQLSKDSLAVGQINESIYDIRNNKNQKKLNEKKKELEDINAIIEAWGSPRKKSKELEKKVKQKIKESKKNWE